MNDGLSHSNVYRIFQDRQGFVWFCTDYGVCYFDGSAFHAIKNDSLLNGSILSISEDHSGNKLVCSIREGIILITDSSVARYHLESAEPPKYVLYAASKNKRLWVIARESGKFLYEIIGNKIKNCNLDSSFPKGATLHKIIEYKDELLFPSNNGLYKVLDTTMLPFLPDLIYGYVSDVKRSKDSTYWISFNNSIVGVKNNRITHKVELKANQRINNILCDKHNNLWIALFGKGILLFKDGKLEDLTPKLEMHRTLINDMLEDSEGNIWIATYDAGAYMLSTLNQIHYSLDENELNIYCNSIEPFGKDKLLVSSIGRVFMWEKGKLKLLPLPFIEPDEFIYFAKSAGDNIYLGTPYNLYKYNLIKQTWLKLMKNRVGTLSMCIDHNKAFWVGSYNNLYHFGRDGGTIDTSSAIIRNKKFNAIMEDHQHNIWLGTSNGLIKYDGKKYAAVKMPNTNNFKIINTIAEDKRHRIWVGTEGGLLCYENDNYRAFTTKNGLTHNRCNKVVEDQNNTLWVATLHGLSYIDLITLEVKGYGAGMNAEEILSLYCGSNDTLFVGTATGLSSIKTNRIVIDDSAPPLYITSVKSSKGNVNVSNGVFLSYAENKLVIDFIGLSFQNANAIEYRYKIEGLNNEWTITKRNSIEVSGLPPGNYNFILNARKNNGNWSKDIELPIYVSTPFWKNWWFLSFAFVVIFAGIFILTWWQTKKYELKKRTSLAMRNKELALHYKVAYLKQQAFRALINPHFIFNCMNSIQHYLNRNDNDRANSYLADFAHLIRLTIENAQDAFIDLNEEIARIELYLSLEQLRFGDELQYEIKIEDNITASDIRLPNMLLQPYIENAIWHGIMPKKGGGKIVIKFERKQIHELKITIEDNGVGISSKAKQKDQNKNKHFGMMLTEERLQLLTQLFQQKYSVEVKEIENKHGEIAGTLIEICLPAIPLESELVQSE